jgi:hypothetical protein
VEESSAGKHEYGGKGRWVKYWAHLGCWISPRYSPFLLGTCFETYEPFISLILKFFWGHHKPWITETADMGAQRYFSYYKIAEVLFYIWHFVYLRWWWWWGRRWWSTAICAYQQNIGVM